MAMFNLADSLLQLKKTPALPLPPNPAPILEELEDAIVDDPSSLIRNENIWQNAVLLTRSIKMINGELQYRLIDLILSGFRKSIRSLSHHTHLSPLSLESFIFLLYSATLGSDNWNSSSESNLLATISLQLFEDLLLFFSELQINRLWSLKSERENVLDLLFQIVQLFFTSPKPPLPLQSSISRVVTSFFVASTPRGKDNVISIFLKQLRVTEGFSELLGAIICEMKEEPILQSEFSDRLFLYFPSCNHSEIIRTNIILATNSSDSVVFKNISSLLINVCMPFPYLFSKKINLLEQLLGSESYQIRCSVVEAIGLIICSLFTDDHGGSEELQKSISPFLKILEERYRDNSSFVRAKVLSVISDLVKKNCVLFSHRLHILQLTIDRLNDKSVIVRKRAVALLVDILTFHPFSLDGGELFPQDYNAKFKETYSELKEKILQFDHHNTVEHIEMTELAEELTHFDEFLVPDLINDNSEVSELTLKLKYYSDGIKFIKEIQKAIGIIFQILYSSSKTEAIGCVEYISLSIHYKIIGKASTLRKLLPLVWSVESDDLALEHGSIKEKLLDIYNQHWFYKDPLVSNSEWTQKCAWNLLSFCTEEELTISEIKSLERLLFLLISKKMIPSEVISLLWKICGDRHEHLPHRRAAFILLPFLDLAPGDRIISLIKSTLNYDTKGRNFDLSIAYHSLRFFDKLVVFRSSSSTSTSSLSLSPLMTGSLVTAISELIIKLLILHNYDDDDDEIQPILQLAIRVIFKVTCDPLSVMRQMFDKLLQIYKLVQKLNCNFDRTSFLSHFTFLIGQVLLSFSTFLEVLEQDLIQKNSSLTTHTEFSTERRVSINLQNISWEEELKDRIQYLREKEMFQFICCFIPLILGMLNGAGATSLDSSLFRSAAFALESMMITSSEMCQAYLKLFIQLLSSSAMDSTVKSNMVIAFGDLILIHGAHLDTSLKFLFQRLSDPSVIVRTNALIVISHLIINGIIKGKGSLADLAMCIVDQNMHISKFTKMFFAEFATKDNALYNSLPDIISGLSADPDLESAKFKSIMQFLLKFIEKEKFVEGIIEKVCSRFQVAKGPVQWANLSFSLAQMNIATERSCRKVIQALPYYYDKLTDNSVFSGFKELLAKMKKVPKQSDEFRKLLDEYEKNLVKYSCQVESTLSMVIGDTGTIGKDMDMLEGSEAGMMDVEVAS